MQRTLQAFLAAGEPIDPIDKAAFRALTALGKLDGLFANASDRGDVIAKYAVDQGRIAALVAYKVANDLRHYPFANELVERANSVSINFTVAEGAPEGTKPELDLTDPNIVRDLAEQMAKGAEETYDELKDRCKPTYAMRGVKSCAIVRGDYTQLLARPADNDNDDGQGNDNGIHPEVNQLLIRLADLYHAHHGYTAEQAGRMSRILSVHLNVYKEMDADKRAQWVADATALIAEVEAVAKKF